MQTYLHLEKTCMPKNILITGSNGQLGRELRDLVEKQDIC
jgi:dTDP-4-dehydrorhamnose reductase